ncbi:TonB-dependent receptor [Halosquirtibacter laminarini]|uniref:TonB-dependent receptor n=1 Tax=Halosquirtibacter laminarini TaxID=3374600 RepID=A0AC61NEB8_9BACT|nr:TonB-dependent receptor [Prolixibacteraceae bacterium]
MKLKEKIFLLIVLSMGFQQPLYSQHLTSHILMENGDPLENANAYILSQKDSSFVEGTVSDRDGLVTINLDKGSYLMRISYVGYETQWEKVDLSQNMDLGTIKMIPLAGLDEVNVVAQRARIISKSDKVIFKVEDTYASNTSSDSYELLSKAPGLIVDTNNKTIGIIGKGTVIVCVNDKEVHLDGDALTAYLSSINPKDVKDIEIIDNPSSRFDASGNAGVLNIVMKKKVEDFLGGNISTNVRKREHGLDYGGNGSITFKKNRFSMNTSISRKKREYQTNTILKQEHQNNLLVNEDATEFRDNNINGIRTQANYDFSPKLSLSVGYNLSNYRYGNVREGDQRTDIFKENKYQRDHQNQYNNDEKNRSSVHNLYTQVDLTTNAKGDKLQLQSGTVRSKDKTDNNLINHITPKTVTVADQLSRTKKDSEFSTFALDYYIKRDNGFELSFGAKYSDSKSSGAFRTTNEADILLLDKPQSLSSNFVYNETIYASYIEATKKFKKLYLRAGLRGEKTKTEAIETVIDSVNTNDYMRYFPNVIIGYNASNGTSITFSFNKRFTRPWIWALNPATYYVGSKLIDQGNPFLKPMNSDNFSLRLGLKDFVASIGYIENRSMFNNQVSHFDEKREVFVWNRFNNYKQNKAYFNLNYNFHFKWWTCRLTSSTAWQVTSNTDNRFTIEDNETWSSYFRIDNDFKPFVNTAWKGLSFNLNYWGNTDKEGKSEKTYGSSSLSFAANLSLMKEKLHITLSGNDILNKQIYKMDMYQNNTITNFSKSNDIRSITLSLSYSFGGNIDFKTKQVNRKEMNRL